MGEARGYYVTIADRSGLGYTVYCETLAFENTQQLEKVREGYSEAAELFRALGDLSTACTSTEALDEIGKFT